MAGNKIIGGDTKVYRDYPKQFWILTAASFIDLIGMISVLGGPAVGARPEAAQDGGSSGRTRSILDRSTSWGRVVKLPREVYNAPYPI